MKKWTEKDLQIAIARMINYTDHYQAIILDNNPKPYRDKKTGELRYIKSHADVGVSDIEILGPECQVLWMEVKTEKGVLSQAQKQFRKMVQGCGHKYCVVRSVEEALRELWEFASHIGYPDPLIKYYLHQLEVLGKDE